MRVAIYARVSTLDKGQDPENQLQEFGPGVPMRVTRSAGNTLKAKAGGRARISGSSSPPYLRMLPSGNLIACCFGR